MGPRLPEREMLEHGKPLSIGHLRDYRRDREQALALSLRPISRARGETGSAKARTEENYKRLGKDFFHRPRCLK